MLGGPDNLLNQWCLGGYDETTSTFPERLLCTSDDIIVSQHASEVLVTLLVSRPCLHLLHKHLRVFIKPTLITRHHFYPQDDVAYLWNYQNGGIGVHFSENLNTMNWGSLDQSCMTAGKITYNPSGNTAPVIIDN